MELTTAWQDWELSTRTKLKMGLQMQIKGNCVIILILASIWLSTCLTRFKMIIWSRRGLLSQFSTTKAFGTHHYQPVIARVNIFFCNGWETILLYESPFDCMWRTDALSKGEFRTVACLQQSTCFCLQKKCMALWVSCILGELQIGEWVDLHSI